MKFPSVKIVFFDLDGTLVDSEKLWIDALICVLQEDSVQCKSGQVQQLVYGRAWRDIYQNILNLWPGNYSEREVLERRMQKHFDRLKNTRNIVIQPSVDLLKTLAKRFPVAVVSGSTRFQIADQLAHAGIEDKVSFYIGSEDYPVGKPAPTPYLTAAKKAGVQPEECIVFEDSEPGVTSIGVKLRGK